MNKRKEYYILSSLNLKWTCCRRFRHFDPGRRPVVTVVS